MSNTSPSSVSENVRDVRFIKTTVDKCEKKKKSSKEPLVTPTAREAEPMYGKDGWVYGKVDVSQIKNGDAKVIRVKVPTKFLNKTLDTKSIKLNNVTDDGTLYKIDHVEAELEPLTEPATFNDAQVHGVFSANGFITHAPSYKIKATGQKMPQSVTRENFHSHNEATKKGFDLLMDSLNDAKKRMKKNFYIDIDDARGAEVFLDKIANLDKVMTGDKVCAYVGNVAVWGKDDAELRAGKPRIYTETDFDKHTISLRITAVTETGEKYAGSELLSSSDAEMGYLALNYQLAE